MAGTFRGRLAAGIAMLTVAACGYDRTAGPGYEDSTALAAVKAVPVRSDAAGFSFSDRQSGLFTRFG